MDSFIKASEDNLYIDVDTGSPDVTCVSFEEFSKMLESRQASIAVVGLGYSGLQLALSFASAGFNVTGIEFDKKKTKKLNSGKSCIETIESKEVKRLVDQDKFFAVNDLKLVSEADVVIVSDQIPTEYPKNKDVSFTMAVFENIISSIKKTQLVVLDSVLAPGSCRKVIYPLFEEQNLKINKDYFLALSPERIAKGHKNINFSMIPRVVSGITTESRDLASLLFKQVVSQVVEVSSPVVAEMVKFLENSYRWVNYALVNEMMIICNMLGISVWEVVKGVRSNPLEYFRFLPGPGCGSSSQYTEEQFELVWKKSFSELNYDLLDNAIKINTYVATRYIIEKITDLLNAKKKCLNESNILIVGVANRRDVAEWNESPAVEIIKMLIDKKANIYYHDPLVPQLKTENNEVSLSSVSLSDDMLKWVDLVVILTDHTDVNYEEILKKASLIFDTRNVTEKIKEKKSNVILA